MYFQGHALFQFSTLQVILVQVKKSQLLVLSPDIVSGKILPVPSSTSKAESSKSPLVAGLLGHSVPVCPAALCSLEQNCRQGEAAALWGAGTARPYRAVSPMAVVVQRNRGLI